MPADLYENEPMGAESTPQGDMQGDDEQNEDAGNENTFLVNKEICPDMKPGDMLTAKILRVHDDEYECVYEPKEEGGEHEEEGMEEPAPEPQGHPMMD